MARAGAEQPAGLRAPARSATLPQPLLIEILQRVAGAASSIDVADTVTAALAGQPGIRAAAVLQEFGSDAIVVGSTGYDCPTMAYGARLPLDSGLPATEAIRTRKLIRQGDGPGWCAVPFGRRRTDRGALLLSLDASPPEAPGDLAALERLAVAVGAALARAADSEYVSAELALVVRALTPPATADDESVASRQIPRGGPVGGDVVLGLVDGTTRWFFVADVCGSGLSAAAAAGAVRTAVRALVPHAAGPAALLAIVDRVLRPETPAGGFVTAAAVSVRDGVLTVASAGHPAPVLFDRAGVTELRVEPGPPLALESMPELPVLAEHSLAVPTGALLVLYTDGLTDHRGPDGADIDIRALAQAADSTGSPDDIAARLLAAADAAGMAVDDTSLLVARLL